MSTVSNADVERAPEQTGAPSGDVLLEVRDLKKYFPVKSGGVIRRTVAHVQAVDGVSFSLRRGGSLGIVGESGCGKSSLGTALIQVLPANAELTGGTIRFD